MRFPALPCHAVLGAIWMSATLFPAHVQAGTDESGETLEVDLAGRLTADTRWFPAAGAFSGQRSLASGFVVEPNLRLERIGGGSFALAPFFRYDHSDPRRTHFDIQEAYVLLFGDVGAGGWELRMGVDQVFWGVTDSQHLVDIVNQVDFVEHPNGEAKLGQPMAHATWFGDWGTLEVLGLPCHRVRTLPGRSGRVELRRAGRERNPEPPAQHARE